MTALQRGEKRRLQDLTSRRTLDVTLQHDLQGADVSVFGLNADRKLQDDRYFVFYNQLSSPRGEVTLTQDALSGRFRLELDALPASVRRLVFVVTHDSAPFSQLGRLSWTLGDPDVRASVELRGDQFAQERAVMVAEVYEHAGEWRVANVGQGFSGGLDACCATSAGGDAARIHATHGPRLSPTPGPHVGQRDALRARR